MNISESQQLLNCIKLWKKRVKRSSNFYTLNLMNIQNSSVNSFPSTDSMYVYAFIFEILVFLTTTNFS